LEPMGTHPPRRMRTFRDLRYEEFSYRGRITTRNKECFLDFAAWISKISQDGGKIAGSVGGLGTHSRNELMLRSWPDRYQELPAILRLKKCAQGRNGERLRRCFAQCAAQGFGKGFNGDPGYISGRRIALSESPR